MNKKANEISMRQILAYTRLGTGGKPSAAQPRQTGRYCSCCKGPLPPHSRGPLRIPLMWAPDSGDVGRTSERSDAGCFLQ